MTEGLDRVHVGGLAGGIDAEEDADAQRDDEREHDGPHGDAGVESLHNFRQQVRREQSQSAAHASEQWADGEAEQNTEQAAAGGEHDGFDQELLHDVLSGCSQRSPDADLAGPLGNCRQHDVHDADAADQQRDSGNHDQQHIEHRSRSFRLTEQLTGDNNRVVFLLVILLQQRLDDLRRLVDIVDVFDLDRDLAEFDLLANKVKPLPGTHAFHDQITDSVP